MIEGNAVVSKVVSGGFIQTARRFDRSRFVSTVVADYSPVSGLGQNIEARALETLRMIRSTESNPVPVNQLPASFHFLSVVA